MTIKIGILGYGNLAKGVEAAITQNPDTKLVGVFTRRDPASIKIKTAGVGVYSVDSIEEFQGKIDVLIICGGSATDLPEMTPLYSKTFNCIDSFDTHANIPKHFDAVDAACKANNTTSLISAGWDPGMFSIQRLYANCILPEGKDYTFWGKGVSQGHSDAIRRIPGVKNGKQYTIPIDSALEAVRSGKGPDLTTRQKHKRVCYVVPEEDADLAYIENAIKTMPNYFADYDTTVNFITEDIFNRDHSGMNHGGFVFRTGVTGLERDNRHIIEYSLKLDSNPEFTGSVLVAYARAISRLNEKGEYGCKTVFDIAPALMSPLSDYDMRAHLL